MRNRQDKCSIPNCKRPWRSREWCLLHYHRWLRHNDPLYGELNERFWRKVDKKGIKDCWNYLGNARAGKKKDYGQISINNTSQLVHRISWELSYGKIPKGLHVLHHCDNPICVNPKHLFLGTNQDNINDKIAKGRWKGGRPKFTPRECPRCFRMKQLCKGYCKGCYSTIRRQLLGRNGKGAFPL